MSEIPVCPICGSKPVFPEAKDVFGTCYDAGCEECGIVTISIQIIDCFDFDSVPSREDAHNSWDNEQMQYGIEFVNTARNEAIKMWSTRHSNQELIHKAAWEIVKRMDDVIPKYWRPELAKDKPGTYCSEMRQMIRKVLTDLGV